jgi:hypothetical protein
MKITITKQPVTIKSKEALHPGARSNNPGFFIEVSTRNTYRDYYLTNKEIRLSNCRSNNWNCYSNCSRFIGFLN